MEEDNPQLFYEATLGTGGHFSSCMKPFELRTSNSDARNFLGRHMEQMSTGKALELQ